MASSGPSIAVPRLVKYVFNIEGIELQKLGVPQQPGKRSSESQPQFLPQLAIR